ncbi:hypothetical protein ACJIZ3_012418 [Penstemon smallii]|uniref:Uncharacterized protein n=1 Tax=Penstemon smallii TaxID=265156 RepID=A0ABD3ULZ1_9LAMI
MGEVGVVNLDGIVLERFGWKCSPPPPPDPMSFSEECLSAAEEAAEEVVNCVRPTLDTQETRRDVIDYIQRLIKSHLGCEVFPYGSVPLKTYLPDGDIDLTALKGPYAEESLAHDVLAVLQAEEQNENAEYQVKDTQFIDAEVKLVKCLVRDIVIDISFNQLGGLSTLCFLEQVDRIVGRNHLFKRSIILVKSWCYFESRILGAHHGLISTYALETLVLYIFHMFHSSLSGPLAVLYRFLKYYSQFDWENYCISLKGPVCRSSLPDIVVKLPESGWNDLMLSEEYLENCMEMFSLPLRGLEEKPKSFQAKHLNIIDPLKENNNLGRSVHRGNFYRIRSAFKYGTRKLCQVLSRPKDKVAEEISDFFANTLARHGLQHRSSIQHLALESGDEEDLAASLASPVELFSEDDLYLKSSVSDSEYDCSGVEEKFTSMLKNELDIYSMKEVSSERACEACYSAEGVAVSGHCIPTSNSSLRNGTSSYTSSSNYSASVSGNQCQKPEYLSSKSSAENGNLEIGKFAFNSWLENREKFGGMNSSYHWCMDNSQAVCVTGSGSSTPSIGESEHFNPLADLTGDYDSHIRSLLYGQFCHGFPLSAYEVYNPPSLPPRIQYKKPWDIVRESMPLKQNQFSLMNSRIVSMEQSVYPAPADFTLPATAFRSEWRPKARGTGTYFPNMIGFYRDRHSQGRGRNKALGNRNQYHRYGRGHMDGFHPASDETNSFVTREVLPPEGRRYQGRGRSDIQGQSPQSVGDTHCKIEFGSVGNLAQELITAHASVGQIEFGSVGNLAKEVISGRASVRGSVPGATLETQGTTAVMKQDRAGVASTHVKIAEEFPPLG